MKKLHYTINYTIQMLLHIQFKSNIKHQVHFLQLSYIPLSLRTRSYLRKENHRLSSELQKTVISTPDIGYSFLLNPPWTWKKIHFFGKTTSSTTIQRPYCKNGRMKKRRLTVVSPESQLTYNIKVTPHVGYCLSVSIPPLRPRQLIGHHRVQTLSTDEIALF